MLSGKYEYFRSNREKLALPIQINLSQKPWTFSDMFFAFLVSK